MIDITTLRLGNILSYKGKLVYVSLLSLDIDDEYTEIIGVTPLGKRAGEKSDWIRAFGDDLQAVFLNEDWFIRFEFVKEESYDFGLSTNRVPLYTKHSHTSGNYVEIILSGNVYWYTTRRYDGGTSDPYEPFIEIEYVHQLQNLFFPLTNEELRP